MLSLRLPGPSLFPSLADFGPANTVPEKQRGQEKALFRTNVLCVDAIRSACVGASPTIIVIEIELGDQNPRLRTCLHERVLHMSLTERRKGSNFFVLI